MMNDWQQPVREKKIPQDNNNMGAGRGELVEGEKTNQGKKTTSSSSSLNHSY